MGIRASPFVCRHCQVRCFLQWRRLSGSQRMGSRQFPLSLTPNRLSRDAVGVIAAVVALGDREVVVEPGLAGHAAGTEMALQELGVRTVPEAEPDVPLGRPR